VRAAFGGGGKTAGQEGALQTILLAPLGRGLLGLVALGLLGYATWRLFQGILDPDDEGGDAKGLIKRADHIVNGLFHAALAMSVGRVALGSGGGGRRSGRLDRDAPAAALRPLAGGGRWGRNPRHRPLPILPGLRREIYGEAQAWRDESPREEMDQARRPPRPRRQGRRLPRHRRLSHPGRTLVRPGRGPRPRRRPPGPRRPTLRAVPARPRRLRARRVRPLHVRRRPLPAHRDVLERPALSLRPLRLGTALRDRMWR
jgi:hypothetical protein